MTDLRILTVILSVFLVADKVAAQDANCDYFQNVVAGQTYYIYSPNYPNSYNRNLNCRWQATCPINTVCRLNCAEIILPETASCTGDRLLISKTGDSALTGADIYCGNGTVDVRSISNQISVGFISTTTSPGGRFICDLTAEAATTLAPPCDCGWKKSTRIAGGTETEINEFPMMVALANIRRNVVYCGAVIIDKRWVLTTAHCLTNRQISNIGVLVGEHNIRLEYESPATSMIRAAQFITHPQYENGYDYNIGLVRTDSDIVFSNLVGPACLPFKFTTTNFTNAIVDVLGWGTDSFGGAKSNYLQKVTLRVLDRPTCKASMGNVVNARILCTFASDKGACQDDSGGPVLYQDPSNARLYTLGAILEYHSCGSTRPGTNTRITKYLKWITTNAVGASFCRK